MPQQLFWVREKDSGQAFQMHSVDAAEGLAIGDYEVIAEPQKDLSPEERLAAGSALRSTSAQTHPELQTPEQRAETRRLANEQAAMLANVPPGASVVVMAPGGPGSTAAPPARPVPSAGAETPARASARATASSAEPRKE